jgi:hypothetical protein
MRTSASRHRKLHMALTSRLVGGWPAQGQPTPRARASGLEISVLSNRADLISGGMRSCALRSTLQQPTW